MANRRASAQSLARQGLSSDRYMPLVGQVIEHLLQAFLYSLKTVRPCLVRLTVVCGALHLPLNSLAIVI